MAAAPAHLQKLAEKMIRSGWHSGVALSMFDMETGRECHLGAGNLDTRTPYFATGVTKLFVTAILLQLLEEGKIDFDLPFVHYLGDCAQCSELHVKDGVDRTAEVTVRHLMSHTSGFGDYFIYKYHARRLRHELVEGVDGGWGFEDVIQRTRSHGAVAAPGSAGRAIYTDTNYHLLGRVIEEIEGQSFAHLVQRRVAERLGLRSTYIYCDPADRHPVPPMSRRMIVHVPRTMTSLQADGGLVTTSRDSLIFLRGFFEGYLFDRRILPKLYTWRTMFYPAEFGTGIMRIAAPWWLHAPRRLGFRPKRVLRKPPSLIGHFGFGGSSCFFSPDLGVYVTGTVNQLADPVRGIVFATRGAEEMAGAIRRSHMSGLLPEPRGRAHPAE
ncbi:serine hydrolase domain-containing protein [Celeribacter sp. ULVN23_4]